MATSCKLMCRRRRQWVRASSRKVNPRRRLLNHTGSVPRGSGDGRAGGHETLARKSAMRPAQRTQRSRGYSAALDVRPPDRTTCSCPP